MKANLKKRGDTALSELAKTYELVRDELADRLDDLAGRIDELDSRALGSRAYASAAAMREKVEKRAQQVQKMRPGRRRSFPWGWLVLGAATLGLAWLLYDGRRREMIRGQVTQLSSRASAGAGGNGVSSAVDSVMGKVRRQPSLLDEERLRSEVESAIAAAEGGMPEGLQVAVEGRTVYLRGAVEAGRADTAAGRAQAVEGVAAVVNLTTPPQAQSGTRRGTSRQGGGAEG